MHRYRDICTLAHLAVTFLAMSVYVTTAQAALITESFTGHVTAGEFAGTIGHGTFSYDLANIVYHSNPADGAYVTPELGTLAISFTILGQTFTEADDIDYPVRPYFQITGAGVPITLDFAISETGDQGLLGPLGNPTPIDEPGVALFFMSPLYPATGGGFETEVFVIESTTPEPSTYLLLTTGLLALIVFSWRKRCNS